MKRPVLNKPASQMYPKAQEALDNAECPFCHNSISDDSFRDTLSVKEYEISGLCQRCQDMVFGDEDG